MTLPGVTPGAGDRNRRAAGVGALIVAALLLTACASTSAPATDASVAVAQTPFDELVPLEDPRSFEGPSSAVLADAEVEPVTEQPEQKLPVEVISYDLDGDTAVTVDDTSSIIAMDLSGSLAATVWGLGLGDRLVGRDVSTTFPGTEHLDVVTSGGHTVNAEAIIALEPTLVLTDGSIGPADVVEQLRDVGITVVFVRSASSFEGAAQLARDVGRILGVDEAGELLGDRIESEVDATRARIAELAPEDEADRLRVMFLYVRGSAGVYYLFGEGSGADDLIEGLSAIDVAGELGWRGMQPLTDEAMVAADPDLILVMSKGLESVDGVDGLLESRPAIALTEAGRHRRFVDMADGQILSFGPRSAHVLEALARAIYAPEAGP
ncbi:heme/hemin ABC transporter substrate-binding protein [Microbacterium sp. I2]|uniref:heme/hemin ABC transporter substrate-binding protein n=1 Tax=Microbacterium sp. I2 TaxID=3391826 RepID=UPI003ED8AEF6|nr:hemin receptor [Microbacterium sp.]